MTGYVEMKRGLVGFPGLPGHRVVKNEGPGMWQPKWSM